MAAHRPLPLHSLDSFLVGGVTGERIGSKAWVMGGVGVGCLRDCYHFLPGNQRLKLTTFLFFCFYFFPDIASSLHPQQSSSNLWLAEVWAIWRYVKRNQLYPEVSYYNMLIMHLTCISVFFILKFAPYCLGISINYKFWMSLFTDRETGSS